MKKLSIVALIALFGIFAFNNFAVAQDDMQEAKASFFGAGIKFKMDKPSYRVRATENMENEKVKEAVNYDVMKGGLLNEALYGSEEDGKTGTPLRAGGRRRGVKDTTLLCETCKAKAVVHSSENCEFCKGKAYGELCDKCIAWSILNACDDCRQKITGATKKESVKETENKESVLPEAEVKTEESVIEDKKIEEITADEESVKPVKKAKKKTSKKKTSKKAVKKVTETEPVVE